MAEKTEFVPFKVHPRIFTELGQRLVTDDFVAIAELVKNSYDANASEVNIKIDTFSSTPNITIEDNGTGMSKDILRDVWTVLFTPFKEDTNKKNKGRVPSGDKGIGRLAAARIGSRLNIFTQVSGSVCHELDLDWNDLIAASNISQSGVNLRKTESPFKKNKGTKIIISDLRRNDWAQNDIVENLSRELARIIPIFSDDNSFNISLKINENDSFSVKSKLPTFLDIPPYLFKGEVNETGEIRASYSFRAGGKIVRRKQLVQHFSNEEFICGPFSFEIRAWELDSESMEMMAGEFGLGKREIREWIGINKGISLYRDGILVLPKSQKRHDWIGLDQRRISHIGHRLATNQIIGSVFVTKQKNSMIKDTSDRERLEDTIYSNQFSDVILEIINLLEGQRSLDKISKSQTKKTLANTIEAPEVKRQLEITQEAIEAIPEAKPVKKELKKLEKAIDDNQIQVKKHITQFGRLAGIGTITSSIIHEIRNMSTPLRELIRFGKSIQDECEHPKRKFGVKYLEASENAMNGLASLSNSFLPLSSISEDKKTKRHSELLNILKNVVDIHKDDIESNKLSVIIPNKEYHLSVDPGELYIIFFNLLSNSVYWLSSAQTKEPEITFKCKLVNNFVQIHITDNGPGIPEEEMEHIFVPGFSKKKNGFGLGLTIVTEIVTKYGGEIACISPQSGKGAHFYMTLPIKNG